MKAEELTRTALLNALGLADALDAIIKDHPQVAQHLPGLPSCRMNIELALAANAANAKKKAADAKMPDWVCNNCGQREEEGLGKPTICRKCGWNNWKQDEA